HLGRHRQIERAEKLGNPGEVVQLAPAALRELPAPVQPDQKKEWRMQARNNCEYPIVEAEKFFQCIHTCLRVTVRKKVSLCARLFLRRAEPAEIGPVLEPVGDLRRIAKGALAENHTDGMAERLTFLDGGQQAEFSGVQTAKIDRIVHAMNREVNAFRLEL